MAKNEFTITTGEDNIVSVSLVEKTNKKRAEFTFDGFYLTKSGIVEPISGKILFYYLHDDWTLESIDYDGENSEFFTEDDDGDFYQKVEDIVYPQ